MLDKELIKLKGTGDGVRIYLDAESSVSDLTSSLYEKLRQFRKFFGDGHCNIYFAGRVLESSDKMRLEAIVRAMLPESTINYGERRKNDRAFEKTLELPEELKAEESEDDGSAILGEIKDVVTTNFKSSRARFYEGTVRDGKTVESDGHLVLVGDVLEGGKLIAVGNVVVMGALKGHVEAGCMGNDKAYIIALDFASSDIRISEKHAYIEKSDFDGGMKKAYLTDGRIVCEDYLPNA